MVNQDFMEFLVDVSFTRMCWANPWKGRDYKPGEFLQGVMEREPHLKEQILNLKSDSLSNVSDWWIKSVTWYEREYFDRRRK